MDKNILLCVVNTKLRDGAGTLEDVAAELDMTRQEVEDALAELGYHFDEAQGKFC